MIALNVSLNWKINNKLGPHRLLVKMWDLFGVLVAPSDQKSNGCSQLRVQGELHSSNWNKLNIITHFQSTMLLVDIVLSCTVYFPTVCVIFRENKIKNACKLEESRRHTVISTIMLSFLVVFWLIYSLGYLLSRQYMKKNVIIMSMFLTVDFHICWEGNMFMTKVKPIKQTYNYRKWWRKLVIWINISDSLIGQSCLLFRWIRAYVTRSMVRHTSRQNSNRARQTLLS